MVTVQNLIQINDCDIALFREYIAKLKGKQPIEAYRAVFDPVCKIIE